MKAELWKKIDELFAVTMASFVQQSGRASWNVARGNSMDAQHYRRT